MLFICGGLQRTGSTVIYQIMGDLVRANGGEVPELKYNVGHWAVQWANKSNHVLAKYHFYTGAFAEAIDRLKVVITVRDPRDVVCSLANLLKKETWEVLRDGDFEKLCGNRRTWLRMIPEDQRHIIKYEDFMATPERVVYNLYSFMNMPFHREDVDAAVEKWSYENNKEREMAGEDVWGQTYHAKGHMFGGEVGQWIDVLSYPELERVEFLAQDWMRDHGYPPYDSIGKDE